MIHSPAAPARLARLFDRLALFALFSMLTALCAAGPAGAQQPAACPPVAQTPTPEQMQAAERASRDRGFLWRIERDARTSYLYGTLHLGKLEWAFPGPSVRGALMASDTLALELDLTDPATMQQFLTSMAARADALPLPAALKERLSRQEAAACLPPNALATLHPLMRAITLAVLAARWDGLDPGYAQEMVLAGAARAGKVPIAALETVEEQMATIIPRDPAQALVMVEQALDQIEAGTTRRATTRLAQAWAEGRLDELSQYGQWCECVTSDEDRAFLKRLNDERNPALAGRIEALHAAGRQVFAAVGALHMTGPQALPTLMAQRGFKVQRVDFPS